MHLVKVPLLLGGVVATCVNFTPPQPKVPANQRAKGIPALERFFSSSVRSYTALFKFLVCSSGIAEIAIILASQLPTHLVSQRILQVLIPGPAWWGRRLEITPTFLAGAVLAYAGGYLRYRSYQALGLFFTAEVSIRDVHRLVTEGPYRLVRHPSYIGAFVCIVGLEMMTFSPGSWARECGIMCTRAGRFAVWVHGAMVMYSLVGTFTRIPLEDRLLKKEFGEEWEAYAVKVPYRILPFIY